MLELINRFENKFEYQSAKQWAQKYWMIAVYASIFYVVTIFAIQRYMKKRNPFDLRRWLFAWSLMLSLFSIVGFFHTGIPLLRTVFTKGWHASVCKPTKTSNWEDDLILLKGTPGLWGFMFCLSKIPELGDTYFIVLRKKKLIFLHWYHHITVMLYCFFQYAHMISAAQWFIVMNYFVHSIMYMYYAVSALQWFRFPKWVNILITSLQLVQMVGGIWINVYIGGNMLRDPDFYCDENIETTYLYVDLALVMYFSYFVLFVHFFYITYFKSSKKEGVKAGREGEITKMEKGTETPVYRRKQLGEFLTTNGNAASANGSVRR